MITNTKPRDRTSVVYRGSTAVEQNTGATLSIVVPPEAVTGDLACFALVAHSNAAVTPPAGTTLIDSFDVGTNAARLHAYTYVVQPGDAGVSKSFALSVTNQSAVGICVAYGNAGGIGATAGRYISTGTEVTNNRAPRVASVWAGEDSAIVGIAGAMATTASAQAGRPATAPAGMTLRQSIAEPNNSLTQNRGIGLFTAEGPQMPFNGDYTMNVAAAHSGSLIFTVVPPNPRWRDTEKVPTSLVGKPVIVYSTSSNAYVEKGVSLGYNTRWVWGDRLTRALGDPTDSRNFAMPGSRAEDICAYLHGNRSAATQAVSGNALSVNQVGTWAAVPDKDALVVIDGIGNNIIAAVDDAQERAGIVHAVRAMFRRVRADTLVTALSPNVTYTGTWSNGSSDGTTSGGFKSTTTPGDKASFTFNNTLGVNWELDWVLLGGDNTAAGTTGATYRVLLDGNEVSSGTTHNQMKQTNWGAGPNYRFVQMAVTTSMPPGVHTLEVEHTGSAGSLLRVDSLQYPKITPPIIVTNTLARMPDQAYVDFPQLSLAKQEAYTALLQSVCDEFTDGRVLLYDPSARGYWDKDTYFAPDMVHQNELGMAHYGHEILWLLTEHFS